MLLSSGGFSSKQKHALLFHVPNSKPLNWEHISSPHKCFEEIVAAHKKMEMNNHELITAVADSRIPIERTAVTAYQQQPETTQLERSRVPGNYSFSPFLYFFVIMVMRSVKSEPGFVKYWSLLLVMWVCGDEL